MKTALSLFFVIYFLFINANHAKPSTQSAQDTTSLAVYVGTYKADSDNELKTIDIWLNEGKLYGAANGQQRLELRPTSTKDQLQIVGSTDVIVFLRDDKKQVSKVKIATPDGELIATKQP
ncbi:hypothetical protein IC229_33040 [Spirosoma sp. BT702]|uniref:DUF3471 domain-containing protein n=1 Tax=Spirosoma profusum TaxID=2771354 RepID=A0A927AW68_9BACT|nr:hypothetical protein [Spirosoma profusum]MBD2705484.1 hypothetical protein [Spirosoma profusum]